MQTQKRAKLLAGEPNYSPKQTRCHGADKGGNEQPGVIRLEALHRLRRGLQAALVWSGPLHNTIENHHRSCHIAAW